MTEEADLWLSCALCNNYKGDRVDAVDPVTDAQVRLFNPRQQDWFEHFAWSANGLKVIGLTPTGRATVEPLHLADDPDALTVRSYWVTAGWHPPTK